MGPTILLLAGEESGDQHGARLARALRQRWPGVRMMGLGGARMAEEGVELLAGLDDLAVMGFVEVLSRLPFFFRLERRIRSILDREEVDLVLPIDYPGFNLRAARAARRRGIPVLYYIAPQVWAWKEGRAARLARDADRIAVILPFEVEVFREAGGRATFVGHPLLERKEEAVSREEFCHRHGFDPKKPLLALFPGSRSQELDRHLEPLLEAGRILQRERAGLQLALARASSLSPERLEATGATVVDDGLALLSHARAAVVKSGTSTLEAALAGTPFVTVYRTNPLTFFLARRLVKVSNVALANLVAGEEVVPELLQNQATPQRIAGAVRPFLRDGSPERERVLSGLARIREALGTPGAAGRVADLAAEILEDGR